MNHETGENLKSREAEFSDSGLLNREDLGADAVMRCLFNAKVFVCVLIACLRGLGTFCMIY